LFRARLDQIINMEHELVRLAQAIDWPVLEERFGAVYSDGPGMPPLPPARGRGRLRLMAGWPSSSTPSTCRTRRCARAGSRTRISSIFAARPSSGMTCRSTAPR